MDIKVVHCCTYAEPHSAHVRLHRALLFKGIDSKVLSLKKSNPHIEGSYNISEFGLIYSWYQRMAYYFNIFRFLFLSKICGLQEGMPYNLGTIGIDISHIDIIRKADIIHLHWINDGYLSLRSIERLFQLNKPIVISLHDSWFMTGGCHVLNGCTKYTEGCKECPQLKRNKKAAARCLIIKEKLLEDRHIVFIAPGRWTKNNAQRSKVLSSKQCIIIGNTLDFSVFRMWNQRKRVKEEREEKPIRFLFGAINSTTTPYKGFEYLKKMLILLKKDDPLLANNIELNIFGAENADCEEIKLYRHKFWGYVKEEEKLAELYNICDVYIVPSLEDSFNQTVLESCACGTPVVSFRTGGICDIIRHKETGYLAEYKDEHDLLEGVLWILENNANNIIGEAASKDVRMRYSQKRIAEEHVSVYQAFILDS